MHNTRLILFDTNNLHLTVSVLNNGLSRSSPLAPNICQSVDAFIQSVS